MRDGHALLPDRHAVLGVEGNHLTGRQAGNGQTVGHDRCAGTTQGEYRRGAFVDPATVAGAGVQANNAVVLGLHHHHVTVGGRRRQHFTGNARTPAFFTGAGIQGNHFALEGAEHDHAVTDANGAGNRQFEVLLPGHVAVVAIQRHHHAGYIGGVDAVIFDRRNQHVEGFALTITDRAAPLLLQDHFFGELGEFGRWQFLFAVAAATHGQKGQGQHCCMFPTDHVTHPLWPGRRA
ncbi:hypothetical protein D3C80_1040750 [compost metagenome]